MISPTYAENIKKYAGAFVTVAAACAIVITPITVWAVGEIEDIAKETLEKEAPRIVDVRMNEVFDVAYEKGFSGLDQRSRRIETEQLEFKYKLKEIEKDNKANYLLQQEKLNGINQRLDFIIEQMRKNQ